MLACRSHSSQIHHRWPAGLLLLCIGLFSACNDEVDLKIFVEPNPILADTGQATIRVESSGNLKNVQLFTSRGSIGTIRIEGGAAVAELTGVTDVGFEGFVAIQADLNNSATGIYVPVVAGSGETIQMTPRSALVNADDGTVVLDVAVLDANGNIANADDLEFSTSAGQVQSRIQNADGSLQVTLSGLRSVNDNPVTISATNPAGLSAIVQVKILAGAAGAYDIVLPTASIEAGQPFELQLQSLDQWGNVRKAFGETAYLSAYQQSNPEVPVPVSPKSTNLFEQGAVTMDVTIHGWGPDVVLQVSPQPEDMTLASESDALKIEEPVIGCIIVEPTGLDSRVQTADALGAIGGFPLKIILSAQACESIRDEGEQFVNRLSGFKPTAFAHLNDGTIAGQSGIAESGIENIELGEISFNAADITYRFLVEGLTQTAWTPVQVTAMVEETVGSLEIEITPGKWRGVNFDIVPDAFFLDGAALEFDTGPLGAGTVTVATGPFVNLFAVDAWGNTVATAEGNVDCSLVAPTNDNEIGQLSGEATFDFVLGTIAQYFGIADLNSEGTLVSARIKCENTAQNVVGYSNRFSIFRRNVLDLGLQGYPANFMVLLEDQLFADGNVEGFPIYVTGDRPASNLIKVAGEPFTVELVAQFALDITDDLGNIPIGIDTPSYLGNVEMSASVQIGGIDGVIPAALETLNDAEVLKSDSPLSKRFECIEGTQTILFPVPTCTPFGADADNPPYHRAVQKVRVLTAADNVAITVAGLLDSNTSLLPSTSATLTVLPAELDDIQFGNEITDEVQVEQAFTVSIEAVDEFGNAVTDESFPIEFQDLSGSVWPKTGMLEDGELNTTLKVFHPWENNLLFVRAPGKNFKIQSNFFNVVEP